MHMGFLNGNLFFGSKQKFFVLGQKILSSAFGEIDENHVFLPISHGDEKKSFDFSRSDPPENIVIVQKRRIDFF